MNYIKMVEEFHNAFNSPVLETPQIPSKQRCDLRVTLLQEELDELKEAISNDDIIEIGDAFSDIMFILAGSILEFGFGGKFDELFLEVHRSNMSKACVTQQEAIETLLHYKEKDGTEGHYKEIDGKWLVYRNGDNKVLKSVNYSPADLKPIIYG
jgi:predicted HAD superfamily Cof-like phosphohydrolase